MQNKDQLTKKFFKRKKEFPNYFAEGLDLDNQLECEARIILISKCIECIANGLTIPHILNNNIVKQNFFKHLNEHVSALGFETASLELFIGGGVVRSLIAYLYKYIYYKKLNHHLSTKVILNKLLNKTNKSFNHTLLLGVGSDFDIYYQITTSEENKLKTAEARLKSILQDYINQIEIKFSLLNYADPIKKSFLPVADIKAYQEQINIILAQGGSQCDWLAFKVSDDGIQNRFILPQDYTNILFDLLLKGEYEYSKSQDGIIAEQKQAIRGCRALLELPFTKIKSPGVLMQELQAITSYELLNEKSKEQIDKLVRNSNFGGANNRVYRSKSTQPLSRLALLSNEYHKKQENKKYLIPYFLPSYNRSCIMQEANTKLQNYLIKLNVFIENYTDAGALYHGTDIEGFLSIIRAGFWISDTNLGQGSSSFGPGTYTTKVRNIAENYTKESMACIIPITINKKYPSRILNWQELDEWTQNILKQQAKALDYSHVFYLLRELYNIDIIINEHIIIQNLHAIKTPKNPADLMDAKILALQQELETKEEKYDKLIILMQQILPLCDLACSIGHLNCLNNKVMLNQYKDLLTIEDEDNLPFCLAAKYGRLDIIDFLINEYDIDPALGSIYEEEGNILLHVESDLALCLAVLHSQVNVVEYLLKYTKVTPTIGGKYYEGIYWDGACLYPNDELDISDEWSEDSLEDINSGWIRFMSDNNFLICLAAAKSTPQILELLLRDSRINPVIGGRFWNDKISSNLPIYLAANQANLPALQILSNNRPAGQVLEVNELFDYTINTLRCDYYWRDMAHIDIIKFLMLHPDFDYSQVDSNWLVTQCARRGLSFTLRLLLEDSRINPTAYNNKALLLAIKAEHIDIVEILLQDKRVELSEPNNKPFILAIEKGNSKIIKLLLSDSRIDPNSNDNAAICMLAERLKNYHPRLENDKRKVNITGLRRINVEDLRKGPSLNILQILIESGKISEEGIQIVKHRLPQLADMIEHWYIRTNLCHAFPSVCKQQESLAARSLEYLASASHPSSLPPLLFSNIPEVLDKAAKILQHYKIIDTPNSFTPSYSTNYL